MAVTVGRLDLCPAMAVPAGIPSEEEFSSRGWAGRRLAAVACLAALVVFLLGGGALRWDWSVPGEPAVRGDVSAGARSADGRGDAERAGIDVDQVVDSVRHRVVPVTGRPGVLAASDDAYRARFDASGFELRPTGSDATLGVSLRHVERGGHDWSLDVGAWRGDSNRAERRVGPGMREAVTVRHGEIEWDVVLGAAPAGRGDLAVSAALSGVSRAVPDGDTLRLSLAGGGELRMGELVVKDATGAELYRALPRVEDERLRLEVPHQVLARARYPLTLDPTVSPERTVSAATGRQEHSDIAFDGTNYLVVWTDYRNGENPDIYGARVKADGTVLDPDGIPISTATGTQSTPQVSYYGPHYLVVWEDNRSGTGYDIYGARVRTNGTVVDVTGTGFSTAANDQLNPDLAFDGTNYLVVWQDRRSGTAYDIFGTRWSPPDNGVLNPAGIPISTAANSQSTPAVVYYGPHYLVVWTDSRSDTSGDIWGTVVFTSGLGTIGTALITAARSQFGPAVAFDGSIVLIVWTDSRSGTSFDSYAARWSPTQGLLDTGGLAISAGSGDERNPVVAANGPFLVAWHDRRSGTNYDVYGARVARNGTVTDPSGFAISTATGEDQFSAVTKGNGANWGTTYDRGGNVFFHSVSPK